MNYTQLLQYLQEHRDDYYQQILQNSEVILKAYRTRTQAQIGTDLGLHQVQVGILLKLLIAKEELHELNQY